jgi:hypothetical protein
MIVVNEHTTTAEEEVIKNNVTIGQYDVVMDTGPGYNSKRLEAVDAMLDMTKAYPELLQISGDLIFRNMDFPGAETIADRLAAMNPLAQIDDKSDIPPQVQMKLKQNQKMIEDLQKELQNAQLLLKYRGDIEQMKQEGETRRTLMKETARAHDTELKNDTKQHDVETRAVTAQNVAEIGGMTQLLKEKMKNSHNSDEAIREFERTVKLKDIEQSDKENQASSTEN